MKQLFAFVLGAGLLLQTAFGAEYTRPEAGRIAKAVGALLEHFHYSQLPLDDAMSQKFLTNYLDSLDYNHSFFLKSDIEAYTEKYGKELDDASEAGDASPAYVIFDQYLKRLSEVNDLAQKLLKEKYDFTEKDSVIAARNKLPWPKNEADREEIMRKRIKYELLQGKLNKEKPEETLSLLSKRYNRLLKNMKELDSQEILQSYLGSLSRCYDPHSDYMIPTEAENFEIQTIKLSLGGIGALLQSVDGVTKVISVVPGGPADLSKQLKANDKIIAVSQAEAEAVDVVEMKLNRVVDLIRGPKGTEVRLTIIPADSTDGAGRKTIKLVRDEIKLAEQFAKGRVIEETTPDGKKVRLGLVILPQFYSNCANDVKKIITRLKLEKIDGIALDLRHNSGGLLDQAVALTGLFTGNGPVVQVRDNRKSNQVLDDPEAKVFYNGPLVVLVSHLSASASEIVAGALQDYGRAVVVGDKTTHGKGTVQSILNLAQFLRADGSNPGKLKLTVSKFYRIDGTTTQRIGVTPDVILPSRLDYMEMGEASLPYCLPAGTTTPATFTKTDRVSEYVTDLRKTSAERIKASKDFAYVQEDIDLLIKRKNEKAISLNEAERRNEMAADKARADARKKERTQRPKSGNKIFEISLEGADKDGPLPLLVTTKQKEKAKEAREAKEKAKEAAGADSADAELDDTDTESAFDPYTEEGMSVLLDYLKLQKQSPPHVAKKADA